ncbi:MAG TPA: hypothetical protein DHW82_07125 [Spirochaetia bacterium]|nr:MAG: hypothetical protein A2Y41_11030 [Spirochaetes bacterium GWB1_36_13]HCL56765.1 hypothetical protein [Spirochaetia bacterium]
MGEYQVTVKSLNPVSVIFKEKTGPYWELGELFQECFAWAAKNSSELVGAIMAIYYDNPKDTPVEKCRAAVCVPVKNETNATEGFQKMVLSHNASAQVTYKGPYYAAEKMKAYQALRDWIAKNSEYTLAENFLIEAYLNSPVNTKEEDLITEISIPIKKK